MIHEHGDVDKLRLEEVEDPSPAPDEVLIQVKAVALNHLDLWVRRGVPGQRMPLPMIPGSDIAGVVKKAGSFVRGLKTGDRVMVSPGVSCGRCAMCLHGRDNLCASYGIIGENRDGGCAELVCVPGVNVLPIPGRMSFDEAAAIPLVFLTAWHMLMERAQVRPGEEVLVHAAGITRRVFAAVADEDGGHLGSLSVGRRDGSSDARRRRRGSHGNGGSCATARSSSASDAM